MGDSSVSCVLTGVTIRTERAVLIPLAPVRYGNRAHPTLDVGARVVSNEGAAAWLAPVMLPIFGRLDGYGGLEGIKKTPHTRFLEARLRRSIEEIATLVGDGGRLATIPREYWSHRDKDRRWNKQLYGCYVLREAWDEFSAATWEDYGPPAYSVWDAGWLEPGVLRGLGFVPGPKDGAKARKVLGNGPHQGERYTRPYEHPALSNVTAWCDEHMSSLVAVDGDVHESIYRVSELQKVLGKTNRSLPAEAIRWAQETPVLDTKLEAEGREYRRGLAQHRREQARYREHPAFTFHCIADTTPPELREAADQWMKAQMDLRFKRLRKGESGVEALVDAMTTSVPEEQDLPPNPLARVPTGVRQTFCDGHFHVTLVAADDGSPQVGEIVACPDGDAYQHLGTFIHGTTLEFTPAVFEALRAAGWKPRVKPYAGLSGGGYYVSVMAPEFGRIYRAKLYRQFAPEFRALLTFTFNMHAANRLYMPTNTGYQYGHYAVQHRVASLAAAYAKTRCDERSGQ